MAGNASFGRLSTDTGVKAFISHHGLEPGLSREAARRRGASRYFGRRSVGGKRLHLRRGNKHGLWQHGRSNRQ